MGKVKVDKNDFYRVILTETLPYEVPITFLNEGLYSYLKNNYGKNIRSSQLKTNINFVNKFIDIRNYTKPYNYRIHKNSKSKRLLSIPHPSVQLQIANLYKNYDALITELCSRSPISLRAPSRVASRFYERELVNFDEKDTRVGVEVESDAFECTSAYASSYFTYSKYNFLYKFYDSYEANRIEKKFEHLTRFDISKCFHNIFIPSFGWSVKGKEFSKRHSENYSIEYNFEKIMLNSNENESSGIIIGPEFSRIFAEVILQKLDDNIIKIIKKKLKLNFDTDYTLRRYVDDYFLYTKNSNSALKILPLILSELEEFKLFVNESKTEFHEVPFITGLTIAKMDIKDLVNQVFEQTITLSNSDELSPASLKKINPSRTSNNFIKELKKLVKVNKINYESVSGYTISELRRKMSRLLKNTSLSDLALTNKEDELINFLLFIIETSFFIYSMDIRVRTTYIITQIVVTLNKLTESTHPSFKDIIRKKIYDESMLLLSKMHDKGKANSIETLNLLISIKTNFEDYPITDSQLLKLFDLKVTQKSDGVEYVEKNENCEAGYFQLMVLSRFIEKKRPLINAFIEDEICDKILITSKEFFLGNTELVCMFFDSLSNPHFNKDFKLKLFNGVYEKLNEKPPSNEKILEFLAEREWFFTWKEDNLAQVLLKKELRNPY